MDRLARVLSNLRSSNNKERKEAEEYILELSRTEFGELVSRLVGILVEEGDMTASVTAGVVLKTFFIWESEEKKKTVNARWIELPEKERDFIKEKMISSLARSDKIRGDVLAQCLSAVARIEVVSGRWDSVFVDLAKIGTETENEDLNRNIIETIGHLCLDRTGIDENIIVNSSGSILTVIINGSKSKIEETRKTSYRALKKSADFISYNLGIEDEAFSIIKAVYEGCEDRSSEISCAAFECYIAMLTYHYKKVVKYVELAFASMSVRFMRSEEEKKIVLGIEMWGVIANREIEHEGEITSQAFSVLMGELLSLVCVDNLERTEEWTVNKAASWLIDLLAQCVPEKMKDPVALKKDPGRTVSLLAAVEEMVLSRELEEFAGGVAALGSLINEGTSEVMAPLVYKTAPVAAKSLYSPDLAVQETGLWVFEKVLRYATKPVEESGACSAVIDRIAEMVLVRSEISVEAAWALAGAISYVCDNSCNLTEDVYPILKRYREVKDSFVDAFFRLSDNDYTMKVAMSSVIGELIRMCPEKHKNEALGVTAEMVSRIKREIFEKKSSEENIYCYLTIIQKSTKAFPSLILSLSQSVVEICQYILGNAGLLGLYTDAYLTLGILADNIGIEFVNYSDSIRALVSRDLSRMCGASSQGEEFLTFSSSLISFIGSMATATKFGFCMYIDEFMPLLINAIGDRNLPREAKITIITTFADISLSSGKSFDRYLDPMFNIAISIVALKEHEDDREFHLHLRESLLDLLSCIIQSSDGRNDKIAVSITVILEVVKAIAQETNDADCVIKCLYLISDIWVLYGNNTKYPYISQQLEAQWILEFISAKSLSTNNEVKEVAINTRFNISSLNQEYE